jgi:hypothetical protein
MLQAAEAKLAAARPPMETDVHNDEAMTWR